MAVTLAENEALTVTTEERTWRTNLESPRGQDVILTAQRELVRLLPDGTIIARDQNAGVVTRALSQVLGTISHTCTDGTVVAPEHIAEALPAFLEAWRAADLAPAEDEEGGDE